MISPDSPVAFSLGGFSVRYYSIAIFFAIVFGSAFSAFAAKKYYQNVSVERFFDILPVVIICAILGARLYYVGLGWGYYSGHLVEILAFRQGGLSIHGAILGGFLGGLWCVKRYSLNLWRYADVFSYGLILGQAIGRLGNFFNAEAFGKPCYFSDWLCLYVPYENRPFDYIGVEYFHPAFLYEMIWDVFVLLVLFFVVRRFAANKHGIVFFSYLILYSLGRLFIEHIRLDSAANFGGFHAAEIVSLVLILAGGFGIFSAIKRTKSQ